ncbi:signal peptidase I [Candidatus Daviesbacteria bacterium]|nr:signal peptidase I [Candidatus Daviesbacteria bacterium]
MEPNVLDTYYGTGDIAPKKSFTDHLGGYFIEFFETLVVFGAIFAAVYLFIAQFHKVSGNSMVPTFHNGDYLITEKVSYRLREPKAGEIIVLKNPRDESQDFIKRIIAVPGDTIQISNSGVYVNSQLLKEGYLPAGTPTRAGAFITEGTSLKASADQYYVIGDNREHSSDSREWGPITKKEIIGRALFRYFPIQAVSLLTNK